jgi:hypothetical protein
MFTTSFVRYGTFATAIGRREKTDCRTKAAQKIDATWSKLTRQTACDWPTYEGARREREADMDRFVRAQNVQHYRNLLEGATEETDRVKLLRLQLLTLLAEEEQKQKDAGDSLRPKD